ncbi:MAG: hypothetical protein Q9163_002715 [Psora crenata]
MTHFRGTSYRAHTSCITEDQKYQGALYKEKSAKKTIKLSPTQSQVPRKAYVEDAPDADNTNAVSIVSAPPEAPDPPSAVPQTPNVNVFDFLVMEETPDSSKVSLAPRHQKSADYTPSVIGSDVGRKESIAEHDPGYDKYGFSYGKDPIPSTQRKNRPKVEYFTPAPKDLHEDLIRHEARHNRHQTASTDRKRKRMQVEELDLAAARLPSQESDDVFMSDAPTPALHTGLTGGLNRLLSKSEFPPSPDYSNGDPEPQTPVQRSKPSSFSHTRISRQRDRTNPPASSTVLVRVKKRRTSDESRPRKKHHRSSHRHHEDSQAPTEKPRHRAIEYSSPPAQDSQQLVVLRSLPELFMSLVTKGEKSKRGMSVHKALKRYHRERRRVGKEGDEKELWKGLRLRRNDRGEVVLFC